MKNLLNRMLSAVARFLHGLFNVGVRLKYVLIVCILLAGGIYFYTSHKMVNNVGGKTDYDEAMRYVEIKNIVSDKFVDEANRNAMGDSAAASMVSGLGDKWSYFMTKEEYSAYLLNSTNEFADIGMVIAEDEKTGGYQVVSISPESPAAWSGLSAGMVITEIDGEKITGKDLDTVRTMIRSRLNRVFTLGINKAQDVITVDCTTSYVSPVTYRMEKTQAGYVQIKSFEAGSGQDSINAIEDLLGQKAEALVIDIRGNAGGLKAEVESLLDYLLPKGNLFMEVDKDGKGDTATSDGMCIQIPIIVLINSQTYDEAEVFAAVMKEYGWASLLGEPTTGRTRTQETIVLEDGSALRLSTKTYLTAKGTDICKTGGVVPDTIVYNSDPDATGTTEGTTGTASDGTASTSSDDQLMAALKYLS